ncbi:histidinol-phosphate transaminase [Thiorhodovibrio frisius]|uniref:Histidinol-phosphate aminotransferase n=1 Tax=Thiorhodovibrio frisius TaxID=631362 RepID=H8Z8E0_9GAMM|nr:histidinol-phosphate transaminase [Thiorhodovibrio frisius]EIC19345.1 histidinol-phosphate aminotransferase [Thiorhodovibrio frisius]WPL22356.1 Histidinol-phosphate aminotransferase 2 [Thiorhodovibrio frisius]
MSRTESAFHPSPAPQIAALNPYVPGKPISELERELGIRESVKLASNENPLGPGDKARAAYAQAAMDLGRYPDGGGFALRQAIARHHGVDAGMVTIGNGSNDVLDMVARTFLHPGRESVFSQHAFAVYPIAIQAVGATPRIAPARDYGHDLDAMAALINDKTDVVWIANPNNPTGTWLTAAPLKDFIASLPKTCICVLDEAYIEYVSDPDFPNGVDWLADFPNLIITRTFSKIHGLAALRVGYSLSHPQAAELMNRVRHPFNVNAPAQAAAIAALDDAPHIARSAELNRAGLAQLSAGLQALGLAVIPSLGNFVTVDLGRPVGPVDQALLREGVICRPVANYGLPNHLRISIGLEAENARCLAALEKVLAA